MLVASGMGGREGAPHQSYLKKVKVGHYSPLQKIRVSTLGPLNTGRIDQALKMQSCDVTSPMHCLTSLKIVANL